MATAIETALVALAAQLAEALTEAAEDIDAPAPVVARNAERPVEVEAGGLVIVRDGKAIAVEEMLSPHMIDVEWGAEVEVYGATVTAREALLAAVALALAGDRTLGGTVDTSRPAPGAERDTAAELGADVPPGALLTVALFLTVPGGEVV